MSNKPQPNMNRKRPHHKSRSGCVQCKARKIKCDERKPVCSHCERYSANCDYSRSRGVSIRPNEPSSSRQCPEPEPVLEPTDYNVTDLSLIHHWSTVVYLGFGDRQGDEKGWQIEVPRLAWQYPFVLRAVLGISALHMSRIDAERSQSLLRRAAYHQQMGLPSYREIIEGVKNKIDEQNCHAVVTFASLTTVHSLASPRPPEEAFKTEPYSLAEVSEWLHLLRGARKILQLTKDWLPDGPMAFQLRAVEGTVDYSANPDDVQLAALKSLFDRRKYAVPTSSVAESRALQMTLELLRESSAIPYLPSQTLGVKLSIYQWVERIPEKYLEMLHDHKPEALILLANLCVLLEMGACQGYWYMEGAADRILSSIGDVLQDDWKSWLTWPIERVQSIRSTANYARV